MTTTCGHCHSAFEQRRRNQRYCSPKCKQAATDKRRRTKRLANDRAREGRSPARFRNLSDPTSVLAKFGLSPREGYAAPVRQPTVNFAVDEVVDHDDDFADLVSVSHPLPPGTWIEMPF